MNSAAAKTVGLVGARGFVGQELIRLLAPHPGFAVSFASSRALAGQTVGTDELVFEDLDAEAVAHRAADIVILALPNELSTAYVEAIDARAPETIIIDLSADHRFESEWVYGLPEMDCAVGSTKCVGETLGLVQDFGRDSVKRARRIANPGCYATAMMLALWPVRQRIKGQPACFGVSGYSGAGTSPSRKNDPEVLADNLIPYSLKHHMHEREVSRHLGLPISFMPHVTSFLRGLTVTSHIPLRHHCTLTQIFAEYEAAYRSEKLVTLNFDAPPEVVDIRNTNGAAVGGFSLAEDGETLVVVSVLDNLLKGAASQALQNMNLACGFLETTGLD